MQRATRDIHTGARFGRHLPPPPPPPINRSRRVCGRPMAPPCKTDCTLRASSDPTAPQPAHLCAHISILKRAIAATTGTLTWHVGAAGWKMGALCGRGRNSGLPNWLANPCRSCATFPRSCAATCRFICIVRSYRCPSLPAPRKASSRAWRGTSKANSAVQRECSFSASFYRACRFTFIAKPPARLAGGRLMMVTNLEQVSRRVRHPKINKSRTRQLGPGQTATI